MGKWIVVDNVTYIRENISARAAASVSDRQRREREFFNRLVDPIRVDDAALRVPKDLESVLEREVVEVAHQISGKTVCECGCGWGVLSCFFAQRGARVYCFDVSDAHIALACRAVRANGVQGRVFPQVMAAEHLAYPDNFFDIVIGNAILHHLEIELAAPEIYRVLRPGGRAVFTEPLGENRLLEWARHCSLRPGTHSHTRDERALRDADLVRLGTFFERLEVRKTRLLLMAVQALQEMGIGETGATGLAGRVFENVRRADDWLLGGIPWLRALCQCVVITLHKNGAK